MATMPLNGVLTLPDWSMKAWYSFDRQAFLIQVEHEIPSRGGWIRAWLVDASGNLRTYPTLSDAIAAIEAFADNPQWPHCREFAGV